MSYDLEFVMIKPDAVQRGLVGEIVQRFEKTGMKLLAMKFLIPSMEQAKEHYAVHEGRPVYEELLKYITSGPVVAMVWEGINPVQHVRNIVGATNPLEAAPGTIRRDFAMTIGRNLVHAADSLENAKTEMSIYFTEEEIYSYKKIDEKWVYEK